MRQDHGGSSFERKRIWSSRQSSVSSTAAGSAAKKHAHLPGKTYIWTEGCLDILQSKGPKSRKVYLSRELAEYLTAYDCRISRLFPERVTFFPNRADHPYSASWLEQNFLRFWYAAFPEKKDSGTSIRAYDFRHHFVYANMNRWLREGKDVNAMLPYLMRYMGHSDVKNTLYYFHLVPDIYGGILDRSRHSEGLIPEVADGGER